MDDVERPVAVPELGESVGEPSDFGPRMAFR